MANSDGLQRMRRLLELLGNPEKKLKIFHVAGTNGKGSTAVFISSVLEKAGYSVGLFTSPHLNSFCERIQIWDSSACPAHNMISQEEFDELKNRIETVGAELEHSIDEASGKEYGPLHLFELLTAMAYVYFERVQPDYVVLECGIGGRLDSTNTIEKPLVSVIAQIGLDHTDILGRTIFKVTAEKAGIIKPGVPVVSQMMDTMVKNVIVRIARETGAEFIDVSGLVGQYRKYELGLRGAYQYDNAATAVEAIRAAGIELNEKDIAEGLRAAVHPGRFEIIDGKPLLVLDGAHNPDAIDAFTKAYSAWARTNRIRRTVVIFGCMKDKSYRRMIRTLCQNLKGCTYLSVAVQDERAEDAETLCDIFAECGRSCTRCASVQEAYEEAIKSGADAVLALGSIYLVGEVKGIIDKE